MKHFTHSFLLPLLAIASFSSLAFAGSVPPIQVTISSHAAKVVYKGMTDASGAFTTPALAPGNYMLLFHSKSAPKGGPFALVVGEGQKEVVANSVPGKKFAQGGVAMRVEVEKAMSLKGQVSKAGVKNASRSTAATPVPPNGERMENGVRVKYVDGKKFVWVENDIAAGASGHWAPADSVEARNAPRASKAPPAQ
ncbi:MAG: carboxypeptidase-like regulatory domain-containing protein [Bryobacteraceae bacterium]